jgi:cellobiose phosphorylase
MKNNGFEKYGEFSPDGREFIITRMDTPRPWVNYAWSDHLLVDIDQRGEGSNMYRNDAGDRSIAINNRFVYLKDYESGKFWTVGWGKIKHKKVHYYCRHGLGYSVIACEYLDWLCEWTISALADSVEVWQVNVTNKSDRDRKISLFIGVTFELGGWTPYGSLQNYSEGKYYDEKKIIYAGNHSQGRPGVRNNAFFAVSQTPDHTECSLEKFLGGCYGEFSTPLSVLDGKLNDNAAMNEDLAGIYQYDITCAAQQSQSFYAANAPCFTLEDASKLAKNASPDGMKEALTVAEDRIKDFKRQDFQLPDPDWSRFFNVWGKQQLMLLKDYARVFLIGFRDTLQDAVAIAAYSPEKAADSILKTLAFQYSDGSALRGWCPIDTHPYGDSGVWLPMAVAEYLRETADYDFLNKEQTYYDQGSGTVWEHLCKALEWFEKNTGEHSLPKLYFGDWNDSLNIGQKGRGESVWLAMALVVALDDAAAIAKHANYKNEEALFSKHAEKMRAVIEECAWDDQWYLRGFSDEGNPVGSKSSPAGNIFSEPQSWAVMAQLAPDRLEKASRAVDENLRTPNGLVVCKPSFKEYMPEYGRISAIQPGWGENGSCYCHVTAFQAVADCMRRDGEAALESLNSILPFNPASSVETSRLEPYAFSNMFRGPDNLRAGETFKGWTSGTVPWAMRCMTHYLCGIRPDFNALIIDPVLPASWPSVSMNRKFRNAELKIEINNPLALEASTAKSVIKLNGQVFSGNRIPVSMLTNGVHQITVELLAK